MRVEIEGEITVHSFFLEVGDINMDVKNAQMLKKEFLMTLTVLSLEKGE